jgi:oligopeptidase A
MTQARSERLRELYYRAWCTRASDQGPNAEAWDNNGNIESILALRHRMAKMLGYSNYAEMSFATKMAESTEQVLEFLLDLCRRCKSYAASELRELEEFAGHRLAPWDLAFYSEKLKQARFEIDDEELRAYFPLSRVLEGLFELIGKLYGLKLTEVPAEGLWHPSARRFLIEAPSGRQIGGLLCDFFARPNKRGGAWMDGCRCRLKLGDFEQAPVAYVVCNFAAPVAGEDAWLTHYDIQTLFHEFGHALHHLLTEIDYPSLSGINGVAWDAVELPSQFLENYAWLPAVLTRISSHRDTGQTLPEAKIKTLVESRRFLAGLALIRQLEFGVFDIRLHSALEPPDRNEVQRILDQTREEIAVLAVPPFNRFQCAFAHIFAGGYAAGYYSYLWAEVLAADAFAAFDEAGAFDRVTAERFRRSILAIGGSRDAMDAFVAFRGRPPELEPLLRQAGIAAD